MTSKVIRYLGGGIIDIAALGAVGYTAHHLYHMYTQHDHASPVFPLVGGLVVAAALHGCAQHARGSVPKENNQLELRVQR